MRMRTAMMTAISCSIHCNLLATTTTASMYKHALNEDHMSALVSSHDNRTTSVQRLVGHGMKSNGERIATLCRGVGAPFRGQPGMPRMAGVKAWHLIGQVWTST